MSTVKNEREGKTMKNLNKLLGLVLLIGLIAMPVYAIEEATTMASTKTLADFQKEYSGTKPIVAWNKYHEYLAELKKAPRPTLEKSRMRIEPDLSVERSRGTKDVVAFTKPSNWGGEGLQKYVKPTGKFYSRDSAAGTKAIVAFTKSNR